MKKKSILLAVFFLLAVTFILCSKSEPPPPVSGYQLNPDVEANIKESDLIDLTMQMIRIRSDYDEGVVANHKEIANFLADYLRDLGMEVHVIEPEPDYPTVIGRLKGSEGTPQLGYLGHYNTVMAGDMSKWDTDPWTPEHLSLIHI